jgi:hypothetical protein
VRGLDALVGEDGQAALDGGDDLGLAGARRTLDQADVWRVERVLDGLALTSAWGRLPEHLANHRLERRSIEADAARRAIGARAALHQQPELRHRAVARAQRLLGTLAALQTRLVAAGRQIEVAGLRRLGLLVVIVGRARSMNRLCSFTSDDGALRRCTFGPAFFVARSAAPSRSSSSDGGVLAGLQLEALPLAEQREARGESSLGRSGGSASRRRRRRSRSGTRSRRRCGLAAGRSRARASGTPATFAGSWSCPMSRPRPAWSAPRRGVRPRGSRPRWRSGA